jgi:FtsP/CotA-like multicopper oxidase with cupredoxin domain
MLKRVWAAAICVSAAIGVCSADELKPPLDPSGDISPDPVPGAGCSLSKSGLVVKAQLVVRNSLRNDVGPYSVKQLPGYATGLTDKGQDSYRPFLIRAKPGDTLRVDLVNQLNEADSDNIVNLHTHGLIVAPRPYFPCNSLGDYIFDSVGPDPNQGGLPLKYRIDIPATIQGPEAVQAIDGEALAKPPFPSGLYWFHSHVHGSAKNHVFAAQTGILAIDPKDNDGTSDIRKGAEEKFLVLRDIQLRVPPAQTPDKISSAASAPIPADSWISGDDYDTQGCRQASNPPVTVTSGFGYCAHPKIYTNPTNDKDTPYDPSHDFVWLFTINGQMGPTITVKPTGKQIWRIANTSATVAYVLNLIDDGTKEEQTFQVLTLDGVVAGTADPTKVGEKHPTVSLKRLLLMPASRAEIVVINTNKSAADVSYTLRTLGFETSGTGQPLVNDPSPYNQHTNDYNGDPWPPIDLAHVVFRASPTAASIAEAFNHTFSRAPEVHMTPAALAAKPAPPVGCVTLPSAATRRVITLDEGVNGPFSIGSTVVDNSKAGKPVDPVGTSAHTITSVPFEHAAPPFLMRHVCAQLHTGEVWEIDNTTNETHNFHIHQTKFRLAKKGDPGVWPDFINCDGMHNPCDAIVDQGNVISLQVPDVNPTGPVKDVDFWHDTIPVAPTAPDSGGKPVVGKTFVFIPFDDPVQVGSFVFHCHILEHEDKGMMATVEVYDPAHPDKSRQGANAGSRLPRPNREASGGSVAFCGKPPADYSFTSHEVRPWYDAFLGKFVNRSQ